MLHLFEPSSSGDWLAARRLVEEYAASLGFDLAFQNFAHELDALSEEYGPPGGCFVLAAWSGEFVGCGAVRPFADRTCEMKRLYVSPAHRGKGVGQLVAQALVARARGMGYETMLLDTVATMAAAQHIYLDLGFTLTEPYRHNPVPGATFFKLQLTRTDG